MGPFVVVVTVHFLLTGVSNEDNLMQQWEDIILLCSCVQHRYRSLLARILEKNGSFHGLRHGPQAICKTVTTVYFINYMFQ